MQSLKHIQETKLSDNGVYEVTEVERQDYMEHEAEWMKEELASERERGVRLLAEFDNYRRRTRQEHTRAEQNGKREVLLALLDVMDDFDRAVACR
jgi:molecular chaperone GrpE